MLEVAHRVNGQLLLRASFLMGRAVSWKHLISRGGGSYQIALTLWFFTFGFTSSGGWRVRRADRPRDELAHPGGRRSCGVLASTALTGSAARGIVNLVVDKGFG